MELAFRYCIAGNFRMVQNFALFAPRPISPMYVVVKVFTPPVARVVEEFLNIRECIYLHGRLKT